MNDAVITVALPMWNARPIAWLCLESMARQNNPGVPWEIIIQEESFNNNCGYSYIEPYIPRISANGGVVRYIPLEEKISLPKKWRGIADVASRHSKVYHMCAADNYYQPNMLIESWDAMSKGADWFQSYMCHFFDVHTKRMVMYKNKKLSGIEMSMATELARKIPYSDKKRVIDLMVLRAAKPQNIQWNESESWRRTVCTHGLNNISGERRERLLNNKIQPFYHTECVLEDVVPEYIYERLINI